MERDDQEWMTYIDGEVRAVCEAKGWGRQIRRKSSVRAHPVSGSGVEDYEWKLIPDELDPPDGRLDDLSGVYYVLSFDKPNMRFVMQHDTSHCGMLGPHWEVETYTAISRQVLSPDATHDDAYPPSGWLRDHLFELTARFRPNVFSGT